MTENERRVAVTAFMASLGHDVAFTEDDGMVQIQGSFDLDAALAAAFAVIEKHRHEAAIMRANKAEEAVIFDP